MGLIETLSRKAALSPRRLVLPEGEDPRIVRAAGMIAQRGWAKVVLHDHSIAVSNVIRLGLHCVRPSLSMRPESPVVSGSW